MQLGSSVAQHVMQATHYILVPAWISIIVELIMQAFILISALTTMRIVKPMPSYWCRILCFALFFMAGWGLVQRTSL